jgi:hypothetical protein
LRATGNVLGFKIERRKPGEDFKEIARDVVYSEYRDRCPTLDEYVYRIRAYNAAGLSGYSEEVSFTKEQWPPKSPTGLTATQRRDGTIILNWEDNSDNETGFSIERDFIEVDTVSENTNTWTDQSPINRPTRYGTTWYMVKAVKEDNGTIISESAYSDVRLKK